MSKNIDWEEVGDYYIYGEWDEINKKHKYPTHDEVAERFNVYPQTVRKKSSELKWGIAREQFQEKLNVQKNTFKSTERLIVSSKYDAQNIRTLEQIQNLLDIYLGRYDNYLNANENDTPFQIDLKDLNILIDILTKKHKLTRDIFGEPINMEKLIQQVKKEVEEKEMGELSLEDLKLKTKELESNQNRIKNLEAKRKELQKLIEGDME